MPFSFRFCGAFGGTQRLECQRLAGQWIICGQIEALDVLARKGAVADGEQGSVKAYGRCFFQGEANCLGYSAESPRALRLGSFPIPAQIERGGSEIVSLCHFSSYATNRPHDFMFIRSKAGGRGDPMIAARLGG
jgi:hypothetical protein